MDAKTIKELEEIAKKVWDNPEFGFQEEVSSRTQVDFLQKEGFEVQTNVAGTKTGYVAKFGNGHPVVALLGEFDALYGLGQEADVTHPSPDGKEMGHGCGHHLLGTGCIAAALEIRDYLKQSGKQGTIWVCGCPAEEAGAGKAYMARDGVFDGVDIALAWHPDTVNELWVGSSQSIISSFFHFKGKASHAAASPEMGRSALDAVELMNVGVNYLREHMTNSDRIHYAIVNPGGKAPNVVQAEAEVNYYVRSANNPACLALFERVCNVAKGAALMTGTQVEIRLDEGMSNMVTNRVLEGVFDQCFREVEAPTYTEEERAYLEAFKAVGEPTAKEQLPTPVLDKERLWKDMQEEPICSYYVENEHSEECSLGSSDVGDVSWVVPTGAIHTACYAYNTPGHSWQLVAQGKSSPAMKGMFYAARLMAKAFEKIVENPSIVEEAKAEWKKQLNGKQYECLIPKGVEPHVSI